MRCILLAYFFLLIVGGVNAQTDDYYFYEEDTTTFKLQDGFYRSYYDLVNNSPINAEHVNHPKKIYDLSFFQSVVAHSKIEFYRNDSLISLKINKVLAYCVEGELYFNTERSDVFNMGIPFFIDNPDSRNRLIDRFFYRVDIVGAIWVIPFFEKPGGRIPSEIANGYTGVEIRYLLYKPSEDKAVELNSYNVSSFISDDKPLYRSYMGLSINEKRRQAFQYVLFYNDENPVDYQL